MSGARIEAVIEERGITDEDWDRAPGTVRRALLNATNERDMARRERDQLVALLAAQAAAADAALLRLRGAK